MVGNICTQKWSGLQSNGNSQTIITAFCFAQQLVLFAQLKPVNKIIFFQIGCEATVRPYVVRLVQEVQVDSQQATLWCDDVTIDIIRRIGFPDLRIFEIPYTLGTAEPVDLDCSFAWAMMNPGPFGSFKLAVIWRSDCCVMHFSLGLIVNLVSSQTTEAECVHHLVHQSYDNDNLADNTSHCWLALFMSNLMIPFLCHIHVICKLLENELPENTCFSRLLFYMLLWAFIRRCDLLLRSLVPLS